MTESAKRGTAKAPAQQAGTGSAATAGDTGTAPGDTAAESAGTATAAEPAAGPAAETTPEGGAKPDTDKPDTDKPDTDKPDIDEVKRKFRAALDRKRQSHAESAGRGGRDTGKVSGAHGPAASRRSFRRKSG